MRSIPFIILMVAIIPLTRLLVGSALGTTAAMVPLVIASIPFIGRQVETSLKEVPYGLVEAALSMGATPFQIIWKVLLPESMSSITAQLTTVIISPSASQPWLVQLAAADLAIWPSATAISASARKS